MVAKLFFWIVWRRSYFDCRSNILNSKMRLIRRAPYITALKDRVFRRLGIKRFFRDFEPLYPGKRKPGPSGPGSLNPHFGRGTKPLPNYTPSFRAGFTMRQFSRSFLSILCFEVCQMLRYQQAKRRSFWGLR